MKFQPLLLLFLFVFPTGAQAASFDCSRARTTLEVLICADDDLSSLDGRIGDAFRQLRRNTSQPQSQRDAWLNEQRDFLKARTDTCQIPSAPEISEKQTGALILCLKGLYTLRLAALEKQVGALGKGGSSINIPGSGATGQEPEKAPDVPLSPQPTDAEPRIPATTGSSSLPPMPNQPAARAQTDGQTVYNCTMVSESPCNTSAVQNCIDEVVSHPTGHSGEKVMFGVSDETGIVMIGKLGSGLSMHAKPYTSVTEDKVMVIAPVQENARWTFILDRTLERLFVAKMEENNFVSGAIGKCTHYEATAP